MWLILILIFFSCVDGVVCTFFLSSNLGGRVSTLGGDVVCFFIVYFSFNLVEEKISANFYNASI